MKFKVNNQVHEIEEGFEHLLPNGAVQITDEEAAILLTPPPPTRQEYIDSTVVAIQSALDADAISAGYDSIHTAVTYADEASVAQFQADGLSFRLWRSKVWEYAYTTLAIYEAALLAYPDLLAQYDIDKAQYDIDIIAEPPLDPLPVAPTAPNEVVRPTIEELVKGIPVR